MADDAEAALHAAADLLNAGEPPEPDRSQSPVRLAVGIAAAEYLTPPLTDMTHLAVRLATLAAPHSALVSPAVYACTRVWFEYCGLNPVVPRSEALPGPVFALVGVKPERSGSRHVGPEGGPLVGREDALRVLDECREDLRQGGPGLAMHLIGEAGIGKSKVLREWLAASEQAGRLAGWLRLKTNGVPYGALPFRAWDRLVAPLAGPMADTARPISPAMTPAQVGRRLQAAGRPSLIVVDDLHRLDPASRHAVVQLLEAPGPLAEPRPSSPSIAGPER